MQDSGDQMGENILPHCKTLPFTVSKRGAIERQLHGQSFSRFEAALSKGASPMFGM